MSTDQPNVLFLLSDQHNYRTVGYAGEDQRGEPVDTPALDGLAESGATFEQTYCQSPLCTPSRIGMLTGREVRECGGWRNGSVLRPGLKTLPGAFAEAGYETALVGKMHLAGKRQFVGFNHRPYGDLTGHTGHQFEPLTGSIDYDSINIDMGFAQDYSNKVYDGRWRHGGVTTAGETEFPDTLLQERNVVGESVAFLREHRHQNPDQPWFLCASLSRPHPPYTAPPRHFERYWPDGVTDPDIPKLGDHIFNQLVAEWFKTDELTDEQVLRARAAYFACVSYLDEFIGDLLVQLDRDGFLENTIVVYTSDHGEMMGEHNLWGKRTWHEESARVPWIIQTPEHRSGEVDPVTIETPVSLADLFPTLCGLAEAPTPDDLDGMDLSETIYSGREPDRGAVFYDFLITRFGEERVYRAIRDGRYKYVAFRDEPELLFDLSDDPSEQHNLIADSSIENPAELEHFRKLLDETMDFEAAAEERARAYAEDEQYTLDIPPGTGNVYHMPDGRLVDADTPLFQPNVLADDASRAFTDFPVEEDGDHR